MHLRDAPLPKGGFALELVTLVWGFLLTTLTRQIACCVAESPRLCFRSVHGHGHVVFPSTTGVSIVRRGWLTQQRSRSRPSSRASLQRVASGRVPGQARSTGCCRPRSRCCRRECLPAGLAAVQRLAGLTARARAVVAVLAVAMVVAAAGVAGAAAAAAGAAVSTAVAAVAAVEGQPRRTSWAGAQRLGSPRRTLGQHRAWAVRRRAMPSSTR